MKRLPHETSAATEKAFFPGGCVPLRAGPSTGRSFIPTLQSQLKDLLQGTSSFFRASRTSRRSMFEDSLVQAPAGANRRRPVVPPIPRRQVGARRGPSPFGRSLIFGESASQGRIPSSAPGAARILRQPYKAPRLRRPCFAETFPNPHPTHAFSINSSFAREWARRC